MEPLAGTPVDDVAFLRELVVRSVADAGADPARVAIAGFSNGALMASRAACDMTDQLASVVLVSGSGPRDMTQRCKPSRALPVMVVFGTADTVVPYEGGQVAMFGGKARGQVAPVREVLDIWRGVNGCTNSDSQAVAGTSPAITMVRGTGCRADVLHFKVTGGGHDWVTNASFDTTTEAWRFVAAHLA
jgi:polyhydroxybutyrate depolymerase